MKRHVFRLLRSLVVAWLVVVVLVAVFQQSLIYFPAHASEPELLRQAAGYDLEPWTVGGEIIGWRRRPSDGTPAANRLLVFHGNAGFALNRWYYVSGFGDLDRGRLWDVHLFEYPGYGARVGKPGEASFTAAAASALAALRAGDARPIFVLGESIGSGPACALAAAQPDQIAGVCLVTPMARLADVAAHHYSFLPVRLLLRDRWDNSAALAKYRGRVAVRLAGADEIIPVEQGHRLFDQFPGPKRRWVEPGAHHNGLDFAPSNPWWREASDFLLSAH